jgi:hypothetical protein
MTDTRPTHDAAYKHLFTQPRMVQDLLEGFAAQGWSETLDLESVTALPASYVGHDLRQRHGDLVWRVRFRDDRWLYLVLLLEFQSNVDRSMAVRMLTYTGLLHQRLIDEGVLREHGALPPVLPIVIYNGRGPWTAPTDVADLLAATEAALAPYQPSQRYFLLDEVRTRPADLPPGNLVSALPYTNSTFTRRPTIAAARCKLPSVMSLFGSSSRSTWVRLVFSSVAILFLEMFCCFMASASCHATTSLIACACASSKIPSFFRKASMLDPIWALLIVPTPSGVSAPLPGLNLALSVSS